MAEHLADLEQWGACSSHCRGGAVTQPVGPHLGDPRPLARSTGYEGDGTGRERSVGGLHL